VIRINLLTTERKVARKKLSFDLSQQVTAVCAGILVVSGLAVGWRFWLVRADASRMESSIAAAQKETERLHGVIVQLQQFEQRKTQLQQRVTLIEELRKDQVGPVHMLDQISLALPSSAWLSEMKQTATPNEVLIDGKSLSLTGLSDFVANLEHSGYFQKSVEIVSSATDTATTPAQGEVIKFEIKAIFKGPGEVDAAKVADTKGGSSQLKKKS
jgi:type IV pilus assembly protein PilN